VEDHIEHKISPNYYGPYKVLQKIGTMKYKLELPTSSCMHLGFHVSWLEKVISDMLLAQTILGELNEEGKIILEHEGVTETRTQQLQNWSILEFLIKYKDLPVEDSTWDYVNFIQERPELSPIILVYSINVIISVTPLLLLLCPCSPHIVIIVPHTSPLLLLLCPYIIIVMSTLIILWPLRLLSIERRFFHLNHPWIVHLCNVKDVSPEEANLDVVNLSLLLLCELVA